MIAWLGLFALALLALAALPFLPLVIIALAALIHPGLTQPTWRVLLWTRYRLIVLGREHIPKTGPVVVAANHISWFDGFFLAAAIPRRAKGLVNATYISRPILSRIAHRAGLIPVPFRGPRAQRAAIEAARAALDEGFALGLFPEGQISRTGFPGTIHRGLEAILSGREHVPVIPAAIDNMWGSLVSYSGGRFFWKWPRLGRRTVIIAFGPPVEPPVKVEALRIALQAAGVRAFERRPLRDQGQSLGTIDFNRPHLVHPKLGLLAAQTENVERGEVRQTGHKPGSVGQAPPGVALRVVGDDGRRRFAPETGRLEALVPRANDWQNTGWNASIDRDGFVFLAEPEAPEPSAAPKSKLTVLE